MPSIANNSTAMQLRKIILNARKLCTHISAVALLTEIRVPRLYALVNGAKPSAIEEWTLRALDQELKKRNPFEQKLFVLDIYVQEWNKKFGTESEEFNNHA